MVGGVGCMSRHCPVQGYMSQPILIISFVTGNSVVTLSWWSGKAKMPCYLCVSFAALYCAMWTDPQRLIACIYRDAERPKVPLKAMPAATQLHSSWASPCLSVLHLKFSAPSLLADCHVEWWDTQAESSGSLGLGLQNEFLQANSTVLKQVIAHKKYLIYWAIMN